MGELLHFIPPENMSDQGLIEHARLIEENIEAGIVALRQVQHLLQQRRTLYSVPRYDDFHDVFPDEPA